MDAEIKDVKNIKSIIDNAINEKEKGNINFDFNNYLLWNRTTFQIG